MEGNRMQEWAGDIRTALKKLDETIESLYSTTCYVEKFCHPPIICPVGDIRDDLLDHARNIREMADETDETILSQLKKLDETIECLEKTEECDDDECHEKGLLKLEEIVDLLRHWSANIREQPSDRYPPQALLFRRIAQLEQQNKELEQQNEELEQQNDELELARLMSSR